MYRIPELDRAATLCGAFRTGDINNITRVLDGTYPVVLNRERTFNHAFRRLLLHDDDLDTWTPYFFHNYVVDIFGLPPIDVNALSPTTILQVIQKDEHHWRLPGQHLSFLLDLGMDVHKNFDDDGSCALTWAVRVTRPDLVRRVLQKGANPNGTSELGDPSHSPLGVLAEMIGGVRRMKGIRQTVLDQNRLQDCRPDLLSIMHRCQTLCKMILEAGATIENTGLLHSLCIGFKSDADVSFARELIVEHGADVNELLHRDRSGDYTSALFEVETPLHEAMWRQWTQMVQMLLEQGAGIDVRGHTETTAIQSFLRKVDFMEMQEGQPQWGGQMLLLLLNAGIDKVEEPIGDGWRNVRPEDDDNEEDFRGEESYGNRG